jgi:uncharacterized surface anchored protein
VDQNFGYTSTIPNPPTGSTTPSCTSDKTPASFTLNDKAGVDNSTNTESCGNVPAGSYTVTEGAEPANFTLESLTCQADAHSSGSQDATNPAQANITVAPGETVTCTYTNQQQLGAIEITKTTKVPGQTGSQPLAGATFSIKSGGDPISGSPFTAGSDGTVCVDNLPFGNYKVQETGAPTGYAIDDSTTHTVTVDNNAKCSDATFGGEAISFSDTPLTDLTVKAEAEAAGATNSTVTCTDSSDTGIGNSPQGPSDPAKVTANGLKPGTYTCTVVVDP